MRDSDSMTLRLPNLVAMGATKPKHSKKDRKERSSTSVTPMTATALLAQSASLLSTGDPPAALQLANKAAELLSWSSQAKIESLPAFSLLGEIHIELGDPQSARKAFLSAAELDPDGSVAETAGGGPEKFMWLAQLSETGGRESVAWYEKGVISLQNIIARLDGTTGALEEVEDKKRKLAAAYCGIIEVWMTDLSWEDDAEAQCESVVDKALSISTVPHVSTLQTLASIRLSQNRIEDAELALNTSIGLWKDLPPDHANRPDFPLRISLSRLLMEAAMEEKALEVLEVLVGEDDQSVEAWYLGGWCLHLMARKLDTEQMDENKEQHALVLSSREWLRNCLKLYQLLDYEDERLKDHALELVAGMNKELGTAEIEDDDEADEWEDEIDQHSEVSHDDHEMKEM